MSIKSIRLSKHVTPCYPLLLLPLIFPSIRVFSNESALCSGWPEYWSFSFSISPSNEYSRLIFFRIDWFDLPIKGTLKSLLQHHSSKASILWRSVFFSIAKIKMKINTDHKAVLLIVVFDVPEHQKAPILFLMNPSSLTLFSQVKAKSL